LGQIGIPDARKVPLSQIYAWVTTTNPDLTVAELEHYGYFPLIQAGVISVDTSGLLHWGADASGRKYVAEANSSTINTFLSYVGSRGFLDQRPTLSGYSGVSVGVTEQMIRVLAVKEIILTNGAASNQELVASKASYYGVVKLKAWYSSAAVDGNTCTFDLQDEDDNALTGVPPAWSVSMLDTALNTSFDGVIAYKGTDQKALEIDVDTGGGAGDDGKILYLIYEYWYET